MRTPHHATQFLGNSRMSNADQNQTPSSSNQSSSTTSSQPTTSPAAPQGLLGGANVQPGTLLHRSADSLATKATQGGNG